jgi:N-acetyl-alpha-D-muramate 1-phosphate uridylyltransferase
MKAMILAAGLGTRLKPWTDKHPKALALVNGKSLLERNIKYLQQFGIYEVIVNVHHFADQIIKAIEKNKGWGSNISISNETDVVLETGGGLKKASHFFQNENDFVLMNVDVLTDMPLDKMIQFHLSNKHLATIATTQRRTSRYFLFNEKDELCGWRNLETGSEKISRPANQYFQKAFSGIHVLNKKVFSYLTYEGKFSMVDVYLEAARIESIKSFDHSSSKFIDVGKPSRIIEADKLFA